MVQRDPERDVVALWLLCAQEAALQKMLESKAAQERAARVSLFLIVAAARCRGFKSKVFVFLFLKQRTIALRPVRRTFTVRSQL